MAGVTPELRALRSRDAAKREDAALLLNAAVTRIGLYNGPNAGAHRRRDRRIVAALVDALDDDGQTVAAAYEDSAVRLWNLRTRRVRAT